MAKKSGRCVMGRDVIHHSPDKHPEQGDSMSADQMDQMVEQAAKKATGTYSNSRQIMTPAQQDLPRDKAPSGVIGNAVDYFKRLGGSK